jgi:dipeptidase D
MVRLINDLLGTGDYGEQFGDVAHTHDFMGPLSLALTTLTRASDGTLVAGVNIRSPVGRSESDLQRRIERALDEWRGETGVELEHTITTSPPYYVADAPHVPVLLDVFRFFSGQASAEPIAIGGGTHARLLPNAVNFGPAMPGEPYTGHSEYEYLTREQVQLNLQMYAAMLVALAGAERT